MPKVIDETIVFQTVINMLISHGYAGATVKEIAHIAGVNSVTLFRKYESKAELFKRAIKHQLVDAPLGRLVFTGELEEDLLEIIKAYFETSHMHGAIVPIMLAELPRHPELKGAFDPLWENMQTILKIIQQYQAEGKLKQETLLTSLNALIGPIMTSQMMKRANLDLPIPHLSAEEHVNTFLCGRKQSNCA